MGAYLSGKAESDKAALDKTTSERLSDALANYDRPATGANVGVVDTSGIEGAGPSFPITGKVTGPATKSDKMQRASAIMGMGDMGKVIGGELLKQNLEPEKLYTLNRGDILQTAGGEVRGKGAPPAPSNKNPFPAVGADGKPGMFVMGDDGVPVRVQGMAPFRTGGEGGDKPPSGYRSDGKGGLAFIPGGPADPGNKAKPPSQAFLRLETDDLKDVQLAGGIASDLNSFAMKMDEGKMTLGPIANIGSKIELATGMANQNAREIGSFKTALEKLRNDSLRLNKGTQTEGDAVRAFNELFQNINDQGFVRQRLDEIKKINRRAQAQRVMTINDRRELSGYDPIDESKYLTQPSAYESPAAQNAGGAAAPGAGGGYASKEAAETALKAKGHKPGESVKVTINGQTGTMVLH
jgi:hypothetical protein